MDSDLIQERDEAFITSNSLFTLRDKQFFDWVRSTGGLLLSNILECQSINSPQILLNIEDVFEIFNHEVLELKRLKHESCFQLTNGNFIIKPGLKSGLMYVLKLLKQAREAQIQTENHQEIHDQVSLIRKDPLINSLIEWCSTRRQFDKSISNSLFSKLVESMIFNAMKSKNQRRYDSFVRKFSLCLYILGGKYTYEFVRLNLGVEMFPSLATVTSLISSTAPKIIEGEFRFNELSQYSNSINVFFAFASEDCTGVIRRINYDAVTDSFVGFVTPLADGIPISKYYRTKSFNQLKNWFDSIEKSPLLNIHMIQHIPAIDKICPPPSFILSGYGTNSSFTAIDVLRRWIYIFDQCFKENTRILGFCTGMISHVDIDDSH